MMIRLSAQALVELSKCSIRVLGIFYVKFLFLFSNRIFFFLKKFAHSTQYVTTRLRSSYDIFSDEILCNTRFLFVSIFHHTSREAIGLNFDC